MKARVSTGGREQVLDVLVNTGAQISLVKTSLLPRDSVRPSQRPVRLKVANGQYMSGCTREAMLTLDFINDEELSRPDLGKGGVEKKLLETAYSFFLRSQPPEGGGVTQIFSLHI